VHAVPSAHVPPASAIWPPLFPSPLSADKHSPISQGSAPLTAHAADASRGEPEALDDRPVPESGHSALRPLPAEVRALLGVTIPDELLQRALGDAIEQQEKVHKQSGDAVVIEHIVTVRVRALRVRKIAKRLMFVTVAPLSHAVHMWDNAAPAHVAHDDTMGAHTHVEAYAWHAHSDDRAAHEHTGNMLESGLEGADSERTSSIHTASAHREEYEVQLIAGRSLIAEMGAEAAAAVLSDMKYVCLLYMACLPLSLSVYVCVCVYCAHVLRWRQMIWLCLLHTYMYTQTYK
jgi:hypothetical protein